MLTALEQGELLGVEEAEGHAVVGRGAVFGYCCAMGAGGIALVNIPSVLRILLMQVSHVLVTVRLGKN